MGEKQVVIIHHIAIARRTRTNITVQPKPDIEPERPLIHGLIFQLVKFAGEP